MTRPDLPLVVFGYAAPDATVDAKLRMTEFAILLGKLAGIDLAVTALPSYERVAQLIHKREIDLAWLSPIPFISLQRAKRIIPLVSHHRGGRTSYCSAVIVPASSRVRSVGGLAGKRAGWVDRYSASGFALPRIQMAAMGLDVRTAFRGQRFYGTHEAVVRAVVEERVDFGATYVRLDRKGAVQRGPWSAMAPKYAEGFRVLATFGEIPSDVIAARSDLETGVRERIVKAFVQLAKNPRGKELIGSIFGAEDFRRPTAEGYEVLRGATASAVEEGLLEADDDPDFGSDLKKVAERVDQTLQMPMRSRADSTQEAEIIEEVEAPTPAPAPTARARVPRPTRK